MVRSSRLAGFYARPLADRVAHVTATATAPTAAWLSAGGGLDVGTADRMSENVIATAGLPLALGLNLRVNQQDYLVPMAVEEPSVVAAASAAARLVRLGGGFTGDADASIMTAQIHVDGCPDAAAAPAIIAAIAPALLAAADAAIPRMCARGGGARAVRTRVLDAAEGALVVEVDVDVGDAMGANLIDTVAEAVAPQVIAAIGGSALLRILTNLALGRRARARCEVSADAVGGDAIADGIARASRFAELDVARAVTHNKGVMNGVDAVAVALGQDWRAIEAGAHGFAAHDGRYRPLATWQRTPTGLRGAIELPLALGLVGGCTAAPGVRAALELIAVGSTQELAVVVAAVGLASNLAALRALASEGIQRGHMRLHARRLAGGAP